MLSIPLSLAAASHSPAHALPDRSAPSPQLFLPSVTPSFRSLLALSWDEISSSRDDARWESVNLGLLLTTKATLNPVMEDS